MKIASYAMEQKRGEMRQYFQEPSSSLLMTIIKSFNNNKVSMLGNILRRDWSLCAGYNISLGHQALVCVKRFEKEHVLSGNQGWLTSSTFLEKTIQPSCTLPPFYPSRRACCSPGWPWTDYIAEMSLNFWSSYLLPPYWCWYYRPAPSQPVRAVLSMDPGA